MNESGRCFSRTSLLNLIHVRCSLNTFFVTSQRILKQRKSSCSRKYGSWDRKSEAI